jgi:hypothetical protein
VTFQSELNGESCLEVNTSGCEPLYNEVQATLSSDRDCTMPSSSQAGAKGTAGLVVGILFLILLVAAVAVWRVRIRETAAAWLARIRDRLPAGKQPKQRTRQGRRQPPQPSDPDSLYGDADTDGRVRSSSTSSAISKRSGRSAGYLDVEKGPAVASSQRQLQSDTTFDTFEQEVYVDPAAGLLKAVAPQTPGGQSSRENSYEEFDDDGDEELYEEADAVPSKASHVKNPDPRTPSTKPLQGNSYGYSNDQGSNEEADGEDVYEEPVPIPPGRNAAGDGASDETYGPSKFGFDGPDQDDGMDI